MKSKFTIFLVAISTLAYGQLQQFSHTQLLKGVKDQWHQINLSNEQLSVAKEDLGDIRLYGITDNKDTIEVPYLLKTENSIPRRIPFKTINTSKNSAGHFFTFEVPSVETINQIYLQFENKNFDWRIALEGSQDQQDWFTLVDNYRILSIENAYNRYKFTTIHFPDAKYRYYRVKVAEQEAIQLLLGDILYQQESKLTYFNQLVAQQTRQEDPLKKRTQIDLHFIQPIPVNAVQIIMHAAYDYYRPITIQYAIADSVRTDKGWQPIYQNFYTGTLSSLEQQDFIGKTRKTDKIRLLIKNFDNEALPIEEIQIKGRNRALVARFTETATYYLAYGQPKVFRPKYDLQHFSHKIPKTLKPLSLGPIQVGILDESRTLPLFGNKWWLWGIMLSIIGLLGWFSLKMLRE